MRILFDQGVPAPLRRALDGHEVSTAYEMQWAELTNGVLLSQANAKFDVLITTDHGIRFQQNLSGLRLAIIVLPTTDWSIIRQHQVSITEAVESVGSGALIALNWS
jgi:predicted nuclease of predicted toxin-antitoxin system